MQFSQFPLDPRLMRGLDAAQYLSCTPVQEATLKAVLEANKDVYAQSQTGTGKTAAFLIATFWHLLKPQNDDQFALILAPTRELVVQIEKEAKLLGQFLNFAITSVYGGTGYEKQMSALRKSPRIVVATPGRLLDFAEQNVINLKKAGVLVIDEADRLFDMGFHQDLLKIIRMMPAAQQRLNLLFSATLNNKVGQLAWEHMNNPESIVIKSEYPTVDGIEQRLFHVGRAEKMVLLLAILKKEAPTSAVIFSNTKAGAAQVAKRLNAAGYKCSLIEGNIPQKKRLNIIADMKSGKTKFLAATDVASRGIHIPNLDLVINFDLPDDAENYIHRIGRTARGTQTTGKAVSFACERFVYNLASIESLAKKKIPVAIIDSALQEVVNEVIKEEALRPALPPSDRPMRTTHNKRSRTPATTASRARHTDSPRRANDEAPKPRAARSGVKPAHPHKQHETEARYHKKETHKERTHPAHKPQATRRNPTSTSAERQQERGPRKDSSSHQRSTTTTTRRDQPRKDSREGTSRSDARTSERPQYSRSQGQASRSSGSATNNTQRSTTANRSSADQNKSKSGVIDFFSKFFKKEK